MLTSRNVSVSPTVHANATSGLALRATLPGMHAHAQEIAADRAAAIDILLLMADADAGWTDYDRALDLLDEAEHAAGPLPAEYEMKRIRWHHLRRAHATT